MLSCASATPRVLQSFMDSPSPDSSLVRPAGGLRARRAPACRQGAAPDSAQPQPDMIGISSRLAIADVPALTVTELIEEIEAAACHVLHLRRASLVRQGLEGDLTLGADIRAESIVIPLEHGAILGQLGSTPVPAEAHARFAQQVNAVLRIHDYARA